VVPLAVAVMEVEAVASLYHPQAAVEAEAEEEVPAAVGALAAEVPAAEVLAVEVLAVGMMNRPVHLSLTTRTIKTSFPSATDQSFCEYGMFYLSPPAADELSQY
jgi:hypothetical protein